MNKKLALVLSAASFASFAAFASSAHAGTPTQVGVEATAIRSAQFTQQVYREYAGRYRMQDGSMLRIVKEGSTVYAEADDNSRVAVKAIAHNRLVSLSGQTEIRFANVDSGKVTVLKTASTNIASADRKSPKLV
jgi:hypothetical protein